MFLRSCLWHLIYRIKTFFLGLNLDYLPYEEQKRLLQLVTVGNEPPKKNGGVVLVREEIPQFNFWVLNKVLGMMAIFDAIGQEYRMEITAKEEGFDIIKSFVQINDSPPKETYVKTYDLGDSSIINLDSLDIKNHRDLLISLYKKYLRLTPEFQKYVNQELNLIKGKRVLGVLIRGTDYSRKKPKGHPIQPTKEMILYDVNRLVEEKAFDSIYLATDEYKNEEFFREALAGKANLIVNKRLYFDEFYSNENDIPYISSCRHNRNNDRFLTSREYFSSIIILANCDSLLAGNCGGSRAAIYMNGGEYQYVHLYDLGLYK